jgi:antitoxin FitA
MSTITVRNLDDAVKRQLRAKAAEHGRSMEEEARIALKRHVGLVEGGSLYDALSSAFGPVRGIELESFPARRTRRPLPDVFNDE